MRTDIEPKGTIRPHFDWVRSLAAVPQHYRRNSVNPAVFIVAPTELKRHPQECAECFEPVRDSYNRGFYLSGWKAPIIFHYACSKVVGLWPTTTIEVYAFRKGVTG